MTPLVTIDASYGEGGGQLVRSAVALAAITGTPLRLHGVRARRATPGLAPQHLAAVRAVAALCDARCDGLQLGAREFSFVPGALKGGDFDFDVGTAGSVTLVLQALLPAMLCAPAATRVRVVGGTDIRGAPPFDYFRDTIAELLRHMDLTIACSLSRRGYYPRGGGEVCVTVSPSPPRPFAAAEPQRLLAIDGAAHVGNLPGQIADRMRAAALGALGPLAATAAVQARALGPQEAVGRGGAIVLRARLRHTVLGAGRVAQRGVWAEALGEAVGAEVALDLRNGATLDEHATDQLLIHCALARGVSEFLTRRISMHATTAMWLIPQFLPVHFAVIQEGAFNRVRIDAQGGPDADSSGRHCARTAGT